jgi:hypothetical protein
MAKPKANRKIVPFKYEMTVEVRRLRLERSALLAYLDVEKLSRATKAEFEVGHVVAGRKRFSVRATVRKGIVTGLRSEGCCANCKTAKMSPQLRELLATARRRLDPTGGRPFRPIPVRQIFDDIPIQFYFVSTPFFDIACTCLGSDCECDYFIKGDDSS